MPRKIVSWECERCGQNFGYDGYREAEQCEFEHITQDAIGKFKTDIRTLLPERKKVQP